MIFWTCWPVNSGFSTLDLASGYWQVSLSPEARCKTAFATHSGLFQFKVMPFGLCNAPATFERLMDRVLQGLRWTHCLVYLDNIISFGMTFEDTFAEPLVALTSKDVPFVWRPACTTAFVSLRDALVRAPVLAFPTETGPYILDTDASNFGLGGVLSQIQNDVECVIAYCSRALRPSQWKYCMTKREMLAAVSMCIQFRSYLRGAKFTLRTNHKSLVWLHSFKDTEGLHTLQLLVAYSPTVPVLYHSPGRS